MWVERIKTVITREVVLEHVNPTLVPREQQAPKRVGFASACQAFGYQPLLGVLRAFGLVMKPILTVND